MQTKQTKFPATYFIELFPIIPASDISSTAMKGAAPLDQNPIESSGFSAMYANTYSLLWTVDTISSVDNSVDNSVKNSDQRKLML